MHEVIRYKSSEKDLEFLKILKSKVDSFLRGKSKSNFADARMYFKIIFFLSVFFGSYILLLTYSFSAWVLFLLGLICGLFSVLIVFNISHDASHGAISKKKWVNKILSYSFNLVGGNEYSWNASHNETHHIYPNIGDIDPDLYQAAPFVRVSYSQPLKKYHRFQHYYAPFLYLLHSLYLIYMKDFQDLKMMPRSFYSLPYFTPSKNQMVSVIFSKLFYLTYSLIIPIIILPFAWWKIVICYIVIHFCMGLFMSLVLIPVHMVEDSSLPTKPDSNFIEESWIAHVFNNTADFSRNSKLANFFFGGLNTHLEHHLFPEICHIHLIDLCPIVEEHANEHGFKYRNMTMAEAIRSHFRLLKKMGCNAK